MLVKELYLKAKEEHDEIKKLTENYMVEKMQEAMEDFTDKTGFLITSISIDILSHYSSRCGLKLRDQTNVIDIETTTDIGEA